MACSVSSVLYAILQALAFLLILVGTPIDMFRAKTEDVFGNTQCITLWGMKMKCYSTRYDIKTDELWKSCPSRRDRFRAGEAFSIISIAVVGVAALFGFIRLCCCNCLRWFCLLLNIAGIATAAVVWVCMVDSYYTKRDLCPPLKDADTKYGAGFALFVAGWCVCVVNVIVVCLPC